MSGSLPVEIKTLKGVSSNAKCTCRRAVHSDRSAARRFLKVVRVQFSIPNGELPDLEISLFSRYLSFILLTGRPRPSLPFPRVQSGWAGDFPLLSRMGRRDRYAFAMSMASFKRGLVAHRCEAHPAPDVYEKWSSNACQESPPVSSPEYLDFVRNVIKREFRSGWDSTYESFCSSFVPKLSARFDRFTNGSDWWRERATWKQFQSYLRGKECPHLQGAKLRYKAVPSVGKVRPMGIPTCDWDLLGPLHKTMYEYVASKEWCLRGSPTAARISRVCTGSVQTSVDLVSATDGLRQDVAQVILTTIFARAKFVPGRIQTMACLYQSPRCRGKDITHGQMMGTYTSFPLLCLQSYVAARWASRFDSRATFLVNGDDTLISASRAVEEADYPEGFQLNSDKTVRAENLVELNSTQFYRSKQGWKMVNGLRRGAFYSDWKGIVHMASACHNAGPSWERSFVRSRGESRILPSQLGLNLKVREVFQLEQRLKRSDHNVLVPVPQEPSRFEKSTSVPSFGDRWSFHLDLFEGGRESGDKTCRTWDQAVQPVARKRYWSALSRSYGLWLSSLAFEKVKKVDPIYCYSSRFDQVEEQWEAPFWVCPIA